MHLINKQAKFVRQNGVTSAEDRRVNFSPRKSKFLPEDSSKLLVILESKDV